jgi:hypothetical protein
MRWLIRNYNSIFLCFDKHTCPCKRLLFILNAHIVIDNASNNKINENNNNNNNINK